MINSLKSNMIRLTLLVSLHSCNYTNSESSCILCNQEDCINEINIPDCKNIEIIRSSLLQYEKSKQQDYNWFVDNIANSKKTNTFHNFLRYQEIEYKSSTISLDDVYLIHILPFKYFFTQIAVLNDSKNIQDDFFYLFPRGECIQKGINKHLGFNRNTLHWTINNKVYAHNWFNKRLNDIAIIVKLRDMLKEEENNQILGGYLEDIMTYGPVKIPKNSIILVPNSVNYLNSQVYSRVETLITEKLDKSCIRMFSYEGSLDNSIENLFQEKLKAPYFKIKESDRLVYSAETENKNYHIDSKKFIDIINKEYNLTLDFGAHDTSGLAQMESVIHCLIFSNLLEMEKEHQIHIKKFQVLDKIINLQSVGNYVQSILLLNALLRTEQTMTNKINLLKKCSETNYLLGLESFCIADRIKITKEEIPEESRELFLKRVSEYVTNIKSL